MVESGADGDCEPSVIVDTATVNCSDRPSQTCHRKDFHPGDCSINVGNSLQGDIPDMVTDVKDVALEDVSTSCADGDDSVCDSNKATGVKDTTLEDVSMSCANISSAVGHMDIDVSEDAADVPGTSVVTLH